MSASACRRTALPTRASSSSSSSRTRWRMRASSAPAMPAPRCPKARPVGVGAQGRAGERRAQPRQVAGRHASTSASGAATPARRTSRARRIEQTVRAAYDIARFTAEDPAAGLPDAAGPGHAGRGGARPRPVPPLGHRRRSARPSWRWRCEAAALRHRPAHHQLRRRRRVGAAVAFLQAGNTRGFRGGYASSRHYAVGGADRRQGRRHAARRLVQLDARRARTGRARGGRPLRRRARAVAAEVAQDQPPARCRCCSSRRWPPACSAPTCRPPAAARCTARRASCSTAWASASCPSTSTSTKTRIMPRGKGSAPFDDEGVRTQRAQGGRRRRGAGLFPVELLGAQARHAHHRPCRRLAQPDADAAA